MKCRPTLHCSIHYATPIQSFMINWFKLSANQIHSIELFCNKTIEIAIFIPANWTKSKNSINSKFQINGHMPRKFKKLFVNWFKHTKNHVTIKNKIIQNLSRLCLILIVYLFTMRQCNRRHFHRFKWYKDHSNDLKFHFKSSLLDKFLICRL